MKYLLLFLIQLIIANSLFAQQMPSYESVVENFFRNYTFTYSETFPEFHKKKDGWHVAEVYFQYPDSTASSSLYWSVSENKYKPLSYPAAESDTQTAEQRIGYYQKTVDWDYLSYQFPRNKYFGYSGWDWDVISDSGNSTLIEDTLCEGLARAYSNYAGGFLFDQSGHLFLNNDTDRVILRDNAPIPASRIHKFISYENKAIEAFRRLCEINPGYTTRVGNIKTKLANEYVFAYSDLLMAGYPAKAHDFLVKAEYSDSLLNICRDFLKNVPSNSILFTGGDNDTYPLWYLQETQHFRKDVIVLNTSLLGLRRFLNMLYKKYRGILFSTPDTIFLKKNFEYFVYDNYSPDTRPTEVSVFVRRLNKYSGETNEYHLSGEPLKKYRTNTIFFNPVVKTGKGSAINQKTIALKDYLFMNDFIILDIISTQLNKRKFFFTYDYYLLSGMLAPSGNIYQLKINSEDQ